MGFQGRDILEYWITQKTTRDRAIVTTEGQHRKSIEWWHFQWPWWTSNPVFKVTAFLKSNI